MKQQQQSPQPPQPLKNNKINKRTYIFLYLFIFELVISIYFKYWVLFWITLFEHTNEIIAIKEPENYSRHIQDFICKILLYFYYHSQRIESLFFVLTVIKDILEAINTFITEMEKSGYFTEKGGWISFYHTISISYCIIILLI
jgi:hypothetical protein